MAQDEIVIKLRVEDGELKISTANIDKQSKALDKNTKKKQQSTKGSNRANKAEKALYQTNLSGSKAFSKMNQTMGGSSGLVAAYATLAANVFAATAAFGALQRAAQFEQLKKGLTELGHQSGRTLSVMAQGLRDVTGGAISAEEAMRAAALGVSGGFGGEQLEGLAKIAKGASITLGRSLPDAFDRLTRGAIKLEPEILDELGIMVRLDDAVEDYGAEIGKAGSALTQMERRQAFMNAILEQGESKFGEIAEAIDPDVYSQLGATFSDLTQSIFSFVNNDILFGFAGLSDIVKLLADNTVLLFGVMMLFGSTIVGKIIPALGSAAGAAGALAEKQLSVAKATATAFEESQKAAQARLGTSGAELGPAYKEELEGLDKLTDKKTAYARMEKSNNASIVRQKKIVAKATGTQIAVERDRLLLLEVEAAHLKTAIGLETRKGAAALASANATSLATAELALANIVQEVTNGTMKKGAAWKAVSAAAEVYSAALKKNTIETMGNAAAQTLSAKTLRWLKVAWFKLIGALQLAKLAFLELFAPIAIIILAIGALVAIWNKVFNTKELKAYKKGMEELDTIIDDLPKKVEKYNLALSNGKNLADGQVRAFEIQSGLLTELNEKMRANIKLREAADEASPTGDSGGTGMMDWLGAQDFAASVTQANAGLWQSGGNKEILSDIKLSPNFFKYTKEAEATLNSLYRIHEGPEYKAASAIISKGIPDQVAFMNKKIKTIMAKTWRSPKALARAFEMAVHSANAAFGALGPAASGLRSAFKEADKEASKFLTTFAKKTSVDAFVVSTSGVVKNLDEMAEAAVDAGKEVSAVIGTALLDIGGKVGSMLGTDFMEAQDRLRKAGQEMDKAGAQIGDGSTYANNVKEAAQALSGFEGKYRELNKDLLQTQKLELSRKTTIDGINKMMKFSVKHYKDISQLAGKDNKLLQKRLRFEQEITRHKFKQVKAIFTGIKESYKDPIWQNKNRERVLTFEQFMLKSEEERNKLIKENQLNSDQYSQLLQGQLLISLQGLEVERAADKAKDEALKQQTERLEKIMEIEKKIRDIKTKSKEIDTKMSNFKRIGITELTAKQEAQFKVKAAKEAAAYAIQNAKREKDLIDIKGRMQMIDIQILNKQLALYNSMEKDTSKWIEDIKEPKAQSDIDKMTELQRRAVDQNVEFLKKQVPLIAAEGANNILKGMESDMSIMGVGEAMGGISDMFKEMKKGEIALTDSEAAASFYKEGLTKGSIYTRDENTTTAVESVETAITLGFEGLVPDLSNALNEKITNMLSVGINVDDILAEAEKKAEYNAEPLGGLPVNSLIKLMDKGAALPFNPETDTPTGTAAEIALGKIEELAFRMDVQDQDRPNFIVKGTQDPVMTEIAAQGDQASKDVVSDMPQPSIDVPDVTPTINGNAEAMINWREVIMQTEAAIIGLGGSLSGFGDEGEAMMEFRGGMAGMMGAVLAFKEATGEDALQQRLAATAAFIGGIGQMIQADAKQSVARIDMLIEAEKNKDGKSKASLDRIKQMESKKLSIQKKAFETNKKMKIAETIISTASAAMKAFETFSAFPPLAAAMAAMVVAMGMKQVAMISKQQFSGGGGNMDAGAPPSINIGKRTNKVDVSKQASAGELAFLRGERGIGTQSTNFTAQGGAAGLRKGYAGGGEILVGERGPETITPLTGLNVVPNQEMKNVVNASFTIHAIDAAGVEEVLVGQQGTIINMIRSAANDHGEEFLEIVDTTTYGGTPESPGGIDY